MTTLADLTREFARTLRAARQAVPLSQAELAAELGVSLRTISLWEAGEALPQPKHRRAVDKFIETNGGSKA
jgi:ribosome-binding protein aMBF1 (putative translation factor)